MKFRKKPVVIDAWLVSGLIENDWRGSPQPDEVEKAKLHTIRLFPNHLEIQTMEGLMHAYKTDWLIMGVKGEFYPCKPDIFAATYEAA